MGPLIFAAAALVAMLAAAALGFRLQRSRIASEQDSETRSGVGAALGLTSTLTAVVLGLVTASAADDFNRSSDMVAGLAIDVITLDNVLDSYGPETGPIRAQLKEDLQYRIDQMQSSEDHARADLRAVAGRRGPGGGTEVLYADIATLAPKTTVQQRLQDRALELIGGGDGFGEGNMAEKRWLFTVSPASLPRAFLGIVLLWIVLEVFALGLFSTRSRSVYVAVGVSALVVASAMFLVLELDDPVDGFFRISTEPLQRAVALIG